jgi:hypothetical protein
MKHKIDDEETIEILSADRVVADGWIRRESDGSIILKFSQNWDGCFHFTCGDTRIHLCEDEHADQLAHKLKLCRKVGMMAIAKHCAMQTDWLTK